MSSQRVCSNWAIGVFFYIHNQYKIHKLKHTSCACLLTCWWIGRLLVGHWRVRHRRWLICLLKRCDYVVVQWVLVFFHQLSTPQSLSLHSRPDLETEPHTQTASGMLCSSPNFRFRRAASAFLPLQMGSVGTRCNLIANGEICMRQIAVCQCKSADRIWLWPVLLKWSEFLWAYFEHIPNSNKLFLRSRLDWLLRFCDCVGLIWDYKVKVYLLFSAVCKFSIDHACFL